MSDKQQWHDAGFARRWNDTIVGTTPVREEHLDIVRGYLDSVWEPGCAVLDVGCGTGGVARVLGDRYAGLTWCGIDASEAMLAIARELHFENARVTWQRVDVARATTLPFAPESFSFAFLVQMLHMLEHDEKRRILTALKAVLKPGATVFIIDRFLLDEPTVYDVYVEASRRIDRLAGSARAMPADYEAYRKKSVEDGDRPETVAAMIALLGECGYAAGVVHVHGDRGLLAARLAPSVVSRS